MRFSANNRNERPAKPGGALLIFADYFKTASKPK